MRDAILAELNRRQFIKHAAVAAVALPLLPLGCAASNKGEAGVRAATAQDWAGAADGPLNPSWNTTITSATEPGEPMLIGGTVFGPDGKTPARGITIYVYHTDAEGYYSREPQNGQPPRPRLRGWMRTGEDGRYEFRTIKPGGYPGRTDPVHIHVTLSGKDYPEYWIDSYWFEGDPRINDSYRSKLSGRGGFNPIITLRRDGQGVLRGERNIRLEHV
ncbi:MAG TPA: twin-arginine translocation signal domain-containing protein [Pyrinomonadaceae bacterium]